jgi:hypothetical protein
MTRKDPLNAAHDKHRIGIYLLIAVLLALPAARHAGSNVTSRFATAVRIVENGSAELGPFAAWTNDVAQKDGGSYSDKAPGVTLILIPVYAMVRIFTQDFYRARHLCRLLTLLPLVLFACAVFWRRLRMWDIDEKLAAASVATWAVGTVAWAYHSMLFGHGFASSLILIGVLFLFQYRKAESKDAQGLAISGLCFGLSIAIEYPTALIGGAAGLYLLSFERNPKRIAIFAALGVILPAAIILAYNGAVFGDPFHIGYTQVISQYYQQQMSHGFMGIGLPKASGLYLLLLSAAKGLLFWSPVFIYSLIGFVFMMKNSPREGVFLSGTFVLYTLVFSGHFEASGGAGLGPRHLTPLAGPLVFAAAWLAAQSSGWKRGVFFGSAIISSVLAAIGVFSEAQMPDRVGNTLYEFALPLLADGVGSGNILGLPDWGAFVLALTLLGVLWALILRGGESHQPDARKYRYGVFFTMVICLVFYLVVAPKIGRTEPGALHQIKGNHFMMRKDCHRASWEYGKAYETRKDPYILLYWSRALNRCGRKEEATLIYNRWLQLNPDAALEQIAIP